MEDVVFKYFDQNKSGQVNYREVTKTILELNGNLHKLNYFIIFLNLDKVSVLKYLHNSNHPKIQKNCNYILKQFWTIRLKYKISIAK